MRLVTITLLAMGGLTLIMEFALVDTVKRARDLPPEARQGLAEGGGSPFGWGDLRGEEEASAHAAFERYRADPASVLASLEATDGDDATLAIWRVFRIEADAARRMRILRALGRRPGRLASGLLEGIARSTPVPAERDLARALLAARPKD